MIQTLTPWLSKILGRSPLALWPVRVKAGLSRGAQWTLFPYSAYWRIGGETDVESAIATLGPLVGQSCWDLGAHFGYYTVGLARAVGPSGQVTAFEPDPRAHARCAHHIRMNQLDNVRLYRAAASDCNAQKHFFINEGSGSTTGHLAYEGETAGEGHLTLEIKTLALDDLVERGLIRPPAFVKVDVEGHGGAALRGAQRTLAAHRPLMVMSFHSHEETEISRDLLEPLGYQCQDGSGFPLPWSRAVFRTCRLVIQKC